MNTTRAHPALSQPSGPGRTLARQRPLRAALALALALGGLAVCLWAMNLSVERLVDLPFTVVVDGEDVTDSVRAGLHGTSVLGLALGLGCAAVALAVVAVVVPLALIGALLVAALALAGVLLAVLGVPLLALAALAALLMSPVLLGTWLLWRLLRPRRWATVPR